MGVEFSSPSASGLGRRFSDPSTPNCLCIPPPMFDILPPPEPWAIINRTHGAVQWQSCFGKNMSIVLQPSVDNSDNNTRSANRTADWDHATLVPILEHWTKFVITAVIVLCVIPVTGVLLFAYLQKRSQMKAKASNKSTGLRPGSAEAFRSMAWPYAPTDTPNSSTRTANNSHSPKVKSAWNFQGPRYPTGARRYDSDTPNLSPVLQHVRAVDSFSTQRSAAIRSMDAVYHTLLPPDSGRQHCPYNLAADSYQTTENPAYEEISLHSLDTQNTPTMRKNQRSKRSTIYELPLLDGYPYYCEAAVSSSSNQ